MENGSSNELGDLFEVNAFELTDSLNTVAGAMITSPLPAQKAIE